MADIANDPSRVLRMLFVALFTIVVPLALVISPAPTGAQTNELGPVYIIDVSGTIDLGLAPYFDRILGQAEQAQAAAVIIEIDTPGGRLDAVLQMRDSLLDSPLRTVALIDSTAFSAGALVALASEEIYFTPGAVMGAATPVVGGTGEVADEKTVSAVRSTFEATAEQRGRDPQIAGAMVDPEVSVEGVIAEGRLLTLTVSGAVEVGYADGVVANRAELLVELGLDQQELVETSLSFAEQLVRFITNPIVASLLLTVGMLALIADLTSGGIGVGVLIGLGLLATFFWGHMLAGLAGWEDVALVLLGLGLIAVEVFVLPGFGVPGLLGLVALLGGAFLAMLNRDFDFVTDADMVRAGLIVSVAFVGVIVGLVVVLSALSRTGARLGSRSGLVLQTGIGPRAPVTERASGGWLGWFDSNARLASDRVVTPEPDPTRDTYQSLVGATGTALSDLRPSGIAEINGRRVDVVTSGEYLHRGDAVEVISDERYRRVVRRHQP